MDALKKRNVKKEIESLSAGLSSADAQTIFYNIVFRKQVEEGLKEADSGQVSDWEDFKKEMRSWSKSK